MAISIISGFDVTSAQPADLKSIIASSSSLTSISSSWRYDGMIVYTQAESELWQLIGGISDSNWELLSTNGSQTYALTASYISNTPTTASTAITSSFAVTASSLVGFNFINDGAWISILNTDTPIVQVVTGSYNASFFDYVAVSGSNTRAGIIFGSWINGLINYTEVTNVDLGDTSKVIMSMALSGNVVQLIANVTDTTPWLIKALARYL